MADINYPSGVEFGEPEGSYEQPPVIVPFTVAGLGLRGEVIYEGDSESVFTRAGIPLVTEVYDMTPPKGKTSHSWSVRVEDDAGVIGYSSLHSILDPEKGGSMERLVGLAVDAAKNNTLGLNPEPPFSTKPQGA